MNTQRVVRTALAGSTVLAITLAAACSSERADWRAASAENTITAYEGFLTLHPEGAFSDSARLGIEVIHFGEAGSVGTVEAYEGFVDLHPDGQLADSARLRIDNLKNVRIKGRLVYEDGSPLVGVSVIGYEGNLEDLTFSMRVGEDGLLANPKAETDSTGFFELVAARDFFEDSRDLVLSGGCIAATGECLDFLHGPHGALLVFPIDEIAAPVDLGDIVIREEEG